MLSTLHWQGDLNAQWSNAGNWLENIVPQDGDTLVIDQTTSGFSGNFSITNDVPSLRVSSLTFNSTTTPFFLTGQPLILDANGSNAIHVIPTSLSPVVNVDLTLHSAGTIDGPISLQKVIDNNGHELTIHTPTGSPTWTIGKITGSGNLRKTGIGQLIISSADYQGVTYIDNGGVGLQASGKLGTSTNGTIISSGGWLSLNSMLSSETISVVGLGFGSGALGGSGNSAYLKPITLTGDTGIFVTNSGSFVTFAGDIGEDSPGRKLNIQTYYETSRTAVLAGNNTYSGDTTLLTPGRLLINGTLANGSDVWIPAGGTLGGRGFVQSSINLASGAKLAPGDGFGTLTAGQMNLNAGATVEIEISGIAQDCIATNLDGSGLNGATLNAFLIGPNFPGNNSVFTIVENTGNNPVSSGFGGLPNGATFAAGAAEFRINYDGGDGNDVTLTFIAPPPLLPVISAQQTSPTTSPVINVSVDFGAVVSEFELADITVSNGTASNFATSDNRNFSFDVTPILDGQVAVYIPTGAALDVFSQETLAATPLSIIVDEISAIPVTMLGPILPTEPFFGSTHFGEAIAVNGNTIVVGASGDDSGASDAGIVYVYDISSGNPIKIATINNPTPETNDGFGRGVAIGGNTIVVGAPYDDASGIASGSVYVFELDALSLSGPNLPVHTISNTTLLANAAFGTGVAIDGDKLVVGAPNHKIGSFNGVGIGFVYDLGTGTPFLAATLNKATIESGLFGNAVSISGETVVVGAVIEDNGESTTGGAYAFDLSTGSAFPTPIPIPNPSPNFTDAFGQSVSISGDTIVIGAPNDDTGGNNAGSVYVYEFSGVTVTPITTITPSIPEDQFGHWVSIGGNRFVASAIGDDTWAFASGRIDLFELIATTAQPIATIYNPTPDFGDGFGYPVAIHGTTVISAAIGDETVGPNASAVYVYQIDDPNVAPISQDVGLVVSEDGPPTNGSFDADDPDNDDDPTTLIFTLLSAPSLGSVINNNDGTFTFDPGTDFQNLAVGESQQVSFSYNATDSHGAVSNTATISVTVNGANDGEPMANPGGPYSVPEGGQVVLDGSGSSDPTGNIVFYEWDFDYDGIAFNTDATGVNPTFSAAGIDGNAARTIALRVTDDQANLSPVVSQSINITNVAPTITLTGAANVDEGSTYALTLGAVTDPGMDIVTQYIVHWGDGQSSTFGTTGTYPHTYASGDNTSKLITVDLVDEDGTHVASGSRSVNVRNVKPEIFFDLTTLAFNGIDGHFTIQGYFIDPGIENWTIEVDYGPENRFETNTIDQDDNDLTKYYFQLSYTYNSAVPGGHRVKTTISDDADSVPHQSNNAIVVGSDGTDDIKVKVGSTKVIINGIETIFEDIDHVVVLGLGGDDVITIDDAVTVRCDLFGGEGNDTLIGGGGPTFFDGGPGTDVIVLGSGSNEIVGADPPDSVDSEVVENTARRMAVAPSTWDVSITGNGPDDALFRINDDNTLEFIQTPDFETPLDADGDPNEYVVELEIVDGQGTSRIQRVSVTVVNQASITGSVFVDVNGNHLFDANEPGIDGVVVQLLDADGAAILDEHGQALTATTSNGGFYLFEDLDPGTYRLHELQPTGVGDGVELLGSGGGLLVANDTMQLVLNRTDVADYVFAELGQTLSSGDTASIGFWQNKHGQELIAQGGVALANWLSQNFGNVFGNVFADNSGSNDGFEVARFYKEQLFKQKAAKSAGPAKVDAQFMATALATFFTSSNLAGNVAAGFGFNVTQTGIGTSVINVGNNGAAFGVANGTSLTIMQLLLATNEMTDCPDNLSGAANVYDLNGDGVIDEYEAGLRAMANAIYTLINEAGDM